MIDYRVSDLKPGNFFVPKIKINFIDGEVVDCTIEEWPRVRSEGVDTLEVYNPLTCKICCASLYWAYPENDYIVVGWGSIRYDPNPLTEILLFTTGEQKERHIEFMPDLKLNQVKLGHWWIGTSAPVDR